MKHHWILTALLAVSSLLATAQEEAKDKAVISAASVDATNDWLMLGDDSTTAGSPVLRRLKIDQAVAVPSFFTNLPNGSFTLNKLAQSSATSGQVATWNGTAWAPATPAAGGTWGSITGTLSSQTDLNSALGAKAASGVNTDLTSLKVGVVVLKATGAMSFYPPASDTDAARGFGLESAMAAASAGDTVIFAPGNYLVAKSTSTVISVATHYSVSAGMTINLNGARLYHEAAFNGAVFFGADTVDGWSVVGPGVIEGTAATSSGAAEIGINTRQSRRWLIADLTIRYFKGVAIQFNGGTYPTGGEYGTYKGSTGIIVNCRLDLNNLALSTGSSSELLDVRGCTMNRNNTAADLYAGATRFTNCEVMWNQNHGLRIRNYGNSAHGSFVGGVIAHNFGFGIQMEAINNGFMIADSVIGADSTTSNKIESLGGGMIITGCIVDSPIYASATPTGSNRFCNNYLSGTQTLTTDLSSAERLKWVMEDNETSAGAWAQNDLVIYRFADDAAAGSGGMVAGRKYTDSDTNGVCIKQ